MIKAKKINVLVDSWNLTGCEEQWNRVKTAGGTDIDLIEDLFSKYPISTILLADDKKLVEIIECVKNDANLKVIIPSSKDEPKTHLYNILYDIFVTHGFEEMDKHQFSLDSERRVCPYCNRNYVGTIDEKRLYIPLDHFYPKSIYPFLGASVNNLFPCCPTCNSGLKGNKDTFIEGVVHPCSINSDTSIFSFEIKSLSFKDILPPEDSFEIRIDNYENNSDLFEWEKIFNKYHKDEVVDLIVKKRCYLNPLYIENLENLLQGIEGIDKDDIKRYVLGGYYNPIDHHKKPLSKLIYDIVKQLGIDSN
ncbi:MAG: hypothetical protein LBM08_07125 [Dysgonamonadaceae bacterium]|jgi:hypothetical protein|nr:hypothetical protein [Dysgonamonadaceae bacterium]